MARTARQAFASAMKRQPGKVNPFSMPVSARTPVPLPPQALFHYWHPQRSGVEACDKAFDRELKLIHPGLYACRPPAGVSSLRNGDRRNDAYVADCRWIIWQKNEQTQHALCPGWSLLFLWPPKDYAPIPLDNRVFANLAIIDPRRYRSGIDYFNRVIEGPMMQAKAKEATQQHQYRHDRRKDYVEATKIKNIGKGNKFSLFHDGGIVPSRGESNWLRELGSFLPGDVLRDDLGTRQRVNGRSQVTVGVDAAAADNFAFQRSLRDLQTRDKIKELVRARRAEHPRPRTMEREP